MLSLSCDNGCIYCTIIDGHYLSNLRLYRLYLYPFITFLHCNYIVSYEAKGMVRRKMRRVKVVVSRHCIIFPVSLADVATLMITGLYPGLSLLSRAKTILV
ncbi:hypothetical protein BDB00DRAFT_806575, partial [Zychaea mexicana]|uniref:uncharacterized protein n=1 Tax=Zychaea mexicana TaxID=64656 RepID=UPI0022FE98DE